MADKESKIENFPESPDAQGSASGSLGSVVLELLDSLPFYVLLIDKDHRILLANKATRDVLGQEPQEIVGKFCPQVIHGLEAGYYPGCPLEECVEKNQPVEREHYDKDNGKWLRIAIYPTEVRAADNRRIYFHMIQDITAQKKAVEALHESEEKYRLLLEELIK